MIPTHTSALMRPVVLLAVLLASLLLVAGSVRAAELPYSESFDLADGSPWPAPWIVGGAEVTVADIQGGRARLNGTATYVARMILTEFAEVDVEVNVTFEFEDVAHQGIGFYVRQNGGTLQEYEPHGQGYAMFLKGNWAWPEDLGIWREIDGVETQFANGYDPVPGGLQNGVRYRLRYRVTQMDASTTLLQAKVWPEADTEPSTWTVETTDTQAELQGTAGGFAADIYNQSGAFNIYLDDISIVPAGDTAGLGEADRVAAIRLGVEPNPIVHGAEILLDLPRSGSATLRIVDVSGRSHGVLFHGHLPAGVSTLPFVRGGDESESLADGVYFLKLGVDGTVVSRRIVVSGN